MMEMFGIVILGINTHLTFAPTDSSLFAKAEVPRFNLEILILSIVFDIRILYDDVHQS